MKLINSSFSVNTRQGKEALLLFLSFPYSVNNSEILNILKLFTEKKDDKNRSKPSFSYLTLTFPVIFFLSSVNEPEELNHQNRNRAGKSCVLHEMRQGTDAFNLSNVLCEQHQIWLSKIFNLNYQKNFTKTRYSIDKIIFIHNHLNDKKL